MAEIRKPVRTYQVEMECEVCGQGMMRREPGPAHLTNPIQCPHACDNCGSRAFYPREYPYVVYEEKHYDPS